MEKKEIVVNRCADCSEIMPLYEKLCYCGGPVKKILIDSDKAIHAKSYAHRKWLYKIRRKNG